MTNIEDRTWDVAFEKTLLICSHGLWAVCPRLTEARLQQQSTRGNFAFSLIQQIIWELRSFFPVGSSVKVYLYVY